MSGNLPRWITAAFLIYLKKNPNLLWIYNGGQYPIIIVHCLMVMPYWILFIIRYDASDFFLMPQCYTWRIFLAAMNHRGFILEFVAKKNLHMAELLPMRNLCRIYGRIKKKYAVIHSRFFFRSPWFIPICLGKFCVKIYRDESQQQFWSIWKKNQNLLWILVAVNIS